MENKVKNMETTADFATLSQNEKLLFSQFRKKINTEAAKAQLKKLEYNLSDVTVGTSVLKTACADANALSLGGICVRPCFVRSCAAFLGIGKTCRIVACISEPHGGDTTDIKVKAVKRAIKDGADEVEVTVPVAQIREGNFSYVRKEIKKLRSASKKRALRLNLECGMLSRQEIVRVSSIAVECGVNSVKTASGMYKGGNEAEMITDISSAVKDKCIIKAEGITNAIEMSSAIDMGAGIIGSKNAGDVARSVLAAAETEV